jgi:ppGpp synthetase/RelA/SpoT-type nucleotidyltranferase
LQICQLRRAYPQTHCIVSGKREVDLEKIKPLYSRKEVNRAGEMLLQKPETLRDWKARFQAFRVLNNWRASHNYPLNTFQANLRTKIKRSGLKNAIVAQRLKRVPSIISKLEREPNMALSTMQDIGGLRAILPTIQDVFGIADDYRNSRFPHQLVKEFNYIDYPKESGYRSVHFVFKYKNPKAPEYNNLRIELQIRNQLQHSWATAVEIVGAFLETSLKSSEGPEKWLEFFSLLGSGFAYMEDCHPHPKYSHMDELEITRKIKTIEKELSVTKTLETFGTVVRIIELGRLNFKYYLLHLVPSEMKVSYQGFHENQLDQASEAYIYLEQKITTGSNEQVVLVSGLSFKDLQKAYPNYFLDSKLFLINLKELHERFS